MNEEQAIAKIKAAAERDYGTIQDAVEQARVDFGIPVSNLIIILERLAAEYKFIQMARGGTMR